MLAPNKRLCVKVELFEMNDNGSYGTAAYVTVVPVEFGHKVAHSLRSAFEEASERTIKNIAFDLMETPFDARS